MTQENLPKKMRMLLYGCKNSDCDELTDDCRRLLEECECDVEINIFERGNLVIIDMSPCVQYIIKNGKSRRIYEHIPEGSPLKGDRKDEGKKVRNKPKSECRTVHI
jgi:hypothetical protein